MKNDPKYKGSQFKMSFWFFSLLLLLFVCDHCQTYLSVFTMELLHTIIHMLDFQQNIIKLPKSKQILHDLFFFSNIMHFQTIRNFSHIVKKSNILHSKWTLLKTYCFYFISLPYSSIKNLAHEFKCPFLNTYMNIYFLLLGL